MGPTCVICRIEILSFIVIVYYDRYPLRTPNSYNSQMISPNVFPSPENNKENKKKNLQTIFYDGGKILSDSMDSYQFRNSFKPRSFQCTSNSMFLLERFLTI